MTTQPLTPTQTLALWFACVVVRPRSASRAASLAVPLRVAHDPR